VPGASMGRAAPFGQDRYLSFPSVGLSDSGVGTAVDASGLSSREVVFDGGNARPERGEKCVGGSDHIGSVGPGNGFSKPLTMRMILPTICRIAAYLSATLRRLGLSSKLERYRQVGDRRRGENDDDAD